MENQVNEKTLYQKKLKAQLDGWKADVAKLKARAAEAGADAQIALNKHVANLELQLADAHRKLDELGKANAGTWDAFKRNTESAWDALKAGVREAASKYRD